MEKQIHYFEDLCLIQLSYSINTSTLKNYPSSKIKASFEILLLKLATFLFMIVGHIFLSLNVYNEIRNLSERGGTF